MWGWASLPLLFGHDSHVWLEEKSVRPAHRTNSTAAYVNVQEEQIHSAEGSERKKEQRVGSEEMPESGS